MVLTGVGIGVGIGLVDEIRKEAWLYVSRGLMAGKQFILDQQTTIGGSFRCNIVLVKDPAVSPQHCLIRAEGEGFVLHDSGSATGTYVNGGAITSQLLRDGDVIGVGGAAFVYNEMAAKRGLTSVGGANGPLSRSGR